MFIEGYRHAVITDVERGEICSLPQVAWITNTIYQRSVVRHGYWSRDESSLTLQLSTVWGDMKIQAKEQLEYSFTRGI